MSLQLPLIHKPNQPPPVPPTVTANSEGGVEEEDRIRNSRNPERMLLILHGRGKKLGKERKRRRNKQKKNSMKVLETIQKKSVYDLQNRIVSVVSKFLQLWTKLLRNFKSIYI